MALPIPNSAAELTADWMTAALRQGNVIDASAVQSITATRIGEDEGFTGGALQRLALSYTAAAPDAPPSLVAKLSPADRELRLVTKSFNVREAQFYLDFAAPDLPVPRCYYADYDAESGATVLLLEDLGAYRPVSFLAGCNRPESESVIRLLAQIHARWWNHPRLATISGADLAREFPFASVWRQYPARIAALLPDLTLPDSFFALGDLIAAKEEQVVTVLYESLPFTLLHRDAQPDNLMFARGAGDDRAILLDWQLAGRGRPTFDVGFFLATAVDPALRRQIEREMVAFYHRLLVEYGVAEYSLAGCWMDYLLGSLGRLFNDVGATVLLDNSSAHKMAWRRAALTRLLAFLADHPVAELVAGL